MSIFIRGTLTELAHQKQMSVSKLWYKIFKQNDIELTEKASEIHKRIIAEKKIKKEKTQQILENLKSDV